MQADPKLIGGGLAGLGAMALIATGYFTLTTPSEQQCQIDLADKTARLELISEQVESLSDATDACKTALQGCAAGGLP